MFDHSEQRLFGDEVARLRRQNLLLRASLIISLTSLGGLAVFAQARTPPTQPTPLGRYQLLSYAPANVVFDTQTGQTFIWMPSDEEKGRPQYLMIRDTVNAAGVAKPVKWADERPKE